MTRWSAEKAHQWYARQPWMVGPNYVPASASNQIEMWQSATFDPTRIDLELQWAQNLGMNTARVFLHDLVWRDDRAGLLARMETFLKIAQKHGIRPMFVLFDSVWNPFPASGPQAEPQKGVHNAGWMQGPGADALQDPAQKPRLQSYVEDIVATFGQDERVLCWDIWNEPDNTNGSSYGSREPKNKEALVEPLLKEAFAWARSKNPIHPLTSGVWIGDWSTRETLSALQRMQIDESDIVTFHNYGDAADFAKRAAQLAVYGRPMICTEYMARTTGSTFENILPLMKELNIGAMNWGFVEGRAQTHIPWDSWQNPYLQEPALWFHEILRNDGTPYKPEEVSFIKSIFSADKRKAS